MTDDSYSSVKWEGIIQRVASTHLIVNYVSNILH